LDGRPRTRVLHVPAELLEAESPVGPAEQVHAPVMLAVFEAGQDQPGLVDALRHAGLPICRFGRAGCSEWPRTRFKGQTTPARSPGRPSMDKIKPLFTATATAVGGRNGHTEASDGLVSVDLSVPKEMGGSGKPGTGTPEHLFAAGYAACYGGAIDFVG